MRFRPIGTRKVRKKAAEKPLAEAPGDTKSRFHIARHLLASRRILNTLIMAFGSFLIELSEEEPDPVVQELWTMFLQHKEMLCKSS
jgi:hypothetical protein